MAAMDFFCSGDDRHRVILLVDLLERAGQTATLRCEPVPDPTNPCLVACTRRALREPWLADLFAGTTMVVAVRLDDAPLPGRCARVIDMQAWPARSADRQVGTLVHWLATGDVGARGPAAVRAGGAARPAPGAGRPARRVRSVERWGNALAGLGLIALVVTGGLLLSLAAPDKPAKRTPSTDGGDVDNRSADRPLPGTAATADSASNGATSAWVDGTAGVAAAGPDVAAPEQSAMAEQPAPREPSVSPEPSVAEPSLLPEYPPPAAGTPAVPTVAPPGAPADALAHLCEAQSIDAARAWAGALSWRQRRRLDREPCVARLLQQPGFEDLRLDRP